MRIEKARTPLIKNRFQIGPWVERYLYFFGFKTIQFVSLK